MENAVMEGMLNAVTENFVWSLIAVCVVFSITMNAVRSVLIAQARERSRREIAAYIAEGSITAEQGERLMRADINRGPAAP